MLNQWLLLVLVGVIVVASLFVMFPVPKAATIHNTIIGNTDVQRILFNDVNIDACTGPNLPASPCIAVDTIELITSGTFWKGALCIKNDGPGAVNGYQLFVDGIFFTVLNSFVNPPPPTAEFICFSTGGNGLRITGPSSDTDVTLAFDKEG